MATCPGKPACGSDRTTDANLTQRNAWTLDALGNWDEFVKRVSGTSVTEPRTNNKANEYATIDPDGSGGASPISLTHDHNGNLTFDGNWTYDYDIENRMTRVRKGTDTYAEYHYDALGRRIRKIIPSGKPDAGTHTYVVNELWQVVSEYHTVSSTTTHIRRYVHAGAGSGAGLSSVRSNAPYVDDHVAFWNMSSGKLYYYHADAQFCTVALVDESGDVSERYVTDPYGKAVTYNGSWASPQATSRLGNPFMHQGLWLDGECGKYQNRHREFLPGMGRFAQRDPLEYVDGANIYDYLLCQPMSYTDPQGTIRAQPLVQPYDCSDGQGNQGNWDFTVPCDGEIVQIGPVAPGPAPVFVGPCLQGVGPGCFRVPRFVEMEECPCARCIDDNGSTIATKRIHGPCDIVTNLKFFVECDCALVAIVNPVSK